MKDNYSTKDYDDFIHKSTHGNRTRRESKSQFVPRERYNSLKKDAALEIKRLKIIALALGVITFAGGYAANNIVHETIPNIFYPSFRTYIPNVCSINYIIHFYL